MDKDILIVNQKKFEELKNNFIVQGKENVHVLTDFDRTLTRAFVEGKKINTVIGQIREGKYLAKDYASKAFALFDKYRPIEINNNIPIEERKEKMVEWWGRHLKLLIECGLNKPALENIVEEKPLCFRENALEFFGLLRKHGIPFVIMSSAPGDMIEMHLGQKRILHENVHVIANFFEFDEKGNVIKYKEPLIHSLNKHEIIVKNFPVFNEIKNRKNVLLIGDALDDTGMIEGFDYDNLIKIGFLNERTEEQINDYKRCFDVVLLNDTNFGFINNLLKEIVC